MERLLDSTSCHVVRGRPDGLLQFSKKEAVKISYNCCTYQKHWMPTTLSNHQNSQPKTVSAVQRSTATVPHAEVNYVNPLMPPHCCHMGTAIKHPVPDWVKPSFVIFDIRALWRSALSVKVPGCQKNTNDGLNRSGTGCFIAVPVYPYGNSWCQLSVCGTWIYRLLPALHANLPCTALLNSEECALSEKKKKKG